MDASHSSSTSSQHYSVLLSTVADLRNDLEKAVEKIRSLEEQNHALSENYQVVKDELIATRGKYNDAKESYLRAVTEKFDADRQNEAFMERLKAQLIVKTKEFEVIREKLVPHDIDQLRIKVQEELEIQHKAQIQEMEQKLEDERSQYFGMKRDYERGKVEYEVLIQHQQREIQALRTERDEVEAGLREQITQLREVEYTPSKDEKLRALKAKVSELTHLTELLREEAKSTRQEKDEAVYELEQARSCHEQAQVHLKSRLATAETNCRGMEERVGRYSSESERKEAQLRSTRQSVEDLTDKLTFTQKQVSDLEKQVSALKDDYTKQTEQTASAFDVERTELQERCEALSDRLGEKEEMLRRAQREAAEATVRAESTEGELRRTHQLQLQEARRKYAAIELELAEVKSSLKGASVEAQQQTDASKQEIEALRGEISKLRRDKDLVEHKIRELELNLESERRKASAAQHDSSARIRLAEEGRREAHSKLSSLEAKLSLARDSLFDTQSNLAAVQANNQRLEQRLADQEELTEGMKREFHAQLEKLGPSFQQQADALKKKLRVALSKEKKRADAYKSKALEAHTRAKENMNILEHWKLTEAMNPRGSGPGPAGVGVGWGASAAPRDDNGGGGGGGGGSSGSESGQSVNTAMLNAAILNAPSTDAPPR